MPASPRNKFLLAAGVLLLLGSSPLAVLSQGSPTAGSGEEEHESKEQTIAKCLKDLTSDKPAIRRRGVLILGKYETNRAQQAVTKALQDPAAEVRQAAVVSLIEKRIPSRNAVPTLLTMLDDDNIHVKRLISSSLRRILRIYRLTYSPKRRKGKSQQTPRQEIQKSIKAAFDDSDENVRKNMVKNFKQLKKFVSNKVLIRRLKDKVSTIRQLALQKAARWLRENEFLKNTQHLVDDENANIRQRLAHHLSSMGTGKATRMLRKLAKDKAPNVSATALIGLLRQQKLESLARVMEHLKAGRIKPEIGVRLIRRLLRFGETGLEKLITLFSHSNPRYRAAALKKFPLTRIKNIEYKTLRKRIQDSSQEVRQAAARLLLRHPEFSKESVRTLIDSTYKDIRRFAIEAASRFSKTQTTKLIKTLLFDPATEVRKEAIQQFIQSKLGGWQSVAKKSLRADNPEIQKATASALLRNQTKETRKLLQHYWKTSANEEFKQWIRKRRKAHPRRNKDQRDKIQIRQSP